MNIFKRKGDKSSLSVDGGDSIMSSESSKASSFTVSDVNLIKCTTPFEMPVNDIKEPIFDLTKEQEAMYETVLKHFEDFITRDMPVNDQPGAPKVALLDEEKVWLSKECLLRYLRATKWKVDAAIKRIEETLIWRRTFAVVNIPGHTDPEKFVTADMVAEENLTGKQLIIGYDNDNRPCLYLRNGYQNTPPSFRQVQHLVFMLEKVIQFMPPGQDTLALLIDFKAAPAHMNLSSKFPSISITRQVMHVLQHHYPERLGRGLFTNIPWIGYAFLKAAGPFIDPYTRLKTIYDQPFENFVPKEQLDKEFNGLLDFEYIHDTYWGEMLRIAEEKQAVIMKNFERLGKRIGLSEYDLRLKIEA